MQFDKRHESKSGLSHWVGVKGRAEPFARFCLNDLGKRVTLPELVAARDLMMAAPALYSAAQAALYWLEEESASPDKTEPADILRVLREAIASADLPAEFA